MKHARPLVSVITLNYNGGDLTLACIDGLKQLAEPGGDIELIVVDNDSSDGSADLVARAHPDVKLVRNRKNLGFAGGCNSGAAAASGEFVAFINNDARPDPQWLVEALKVLRDNVDVACVASKVVSWEGDRVDYDGRAGVTFYGFGYREGFGEPLPTDPEDITEVLFGTGSAIVVRRDAYERVGGYDERFFLFFEDVDFGWRLWLAGYRVLYVPTSLVYHQHHGTMKKHGAWREDFLLERNALFSLIKNLDDEHLARALPAALMLSIRRGFMHEDESSSQLDLEDFVDDDAERVSVGKRAAASAFAVDQLARRLPEILEARREVQATRVRADHEIFRLVRHPMLPSLPHAEFGRLIGLLDQLLDIRSIFQVRRRISVVTGDPLGRRLSGPGIRALELARVLSRFHDVRLVSTTSASLEVAGIEVAAVTNRTQVRALDAWSDIIILQGFLLHEYPSLVDSDTTMVVDLYDPFHLEQLEQSRGIDPPTRARMTSTTVDVLNQQIRRGDFFMCASSKQRDFWLGQLAAMGRVNPVTYDADETLGALLAVVPFGISETPPHHRRPVLRGVVDGIGEDDRILLWGGGLYPWFDPVTLVQALDLVRATVPNVRLVFMGAKHPNANVPATRTVEETRAIAADLGILDTHVFILDHWVDYDDRQDYLLEADIGVSTHLDHIETAFSFRTRILDYLWAGLPIVTTGGDAMGDLVELEGLGRVVEPANVKELAQALEDLLIHDDVRAECARRVRDVAPRYSWTAVAAPLVDFCARSERAPDLRLPDLVGTPGVFTAAPRELSLTRAVKLTTQSLSRDGVRVTARRVIGRLRRS